MTLIVRVGASFVFTSASLVLTATVAFGQCKPAGVPFVPMSVVMSQGGYLSSDGRGAYVDGPQGSTVNLHNAASLVTNDGTSVGKNSRYIAFNLNGPVVGDPLAQLLGVIQDRQAEVHVLYKQDPVGTDGLRQIHSIQELPDDGVFYTSERTDLFVHINGVRYLLMFGGGTWPINTCQPGAGAIFGAPGTTKLQIARQGIRTRCRRRPDRLRGSSTTAIRSRPSTRDCTTSASSSRFRRSSKARASRRIDTVPGARRTQGTLRARTPPSKAMQTARVRLEFQQHEGANDS